MRSFIKVALVSMTAGLIYTGCSGVKFDAHVPDSCTDTNNTHGAGSCKVNGSTIDYDYSVALGDVDILFVDDNSGSMYVEQEKMANQFPGFLDSISTLNYQIGIITTDVAGNGPGSQGRLIDFGGGQTILKNSSRVRDTTHYSNVTKFQNTIKRAETLLCPNQAGCPSGDERGIYAINMAFDRGLSLFRPGGHLAIVVLSDEDERSSGGGAPGSSVNGGAISNSFLAQDYDMPLTFAQKASHQLKGLKSVSVHSIIIRPQTAISNQDTVCWSQQNNQGGGVKGYYGTQYAMLSVPTSEMKASFGGLMQGTLGSICSSNYTQEMGQISQFLNQKKIALPCMPVNGSLNVDFEPDQPGVTTTIDQDHVLHFAPFIAAGVKVNLQFTCDL